ncbi:MAG: portal protein [Burkholderiales bacterium]
MTPRQLRELAEHLFSSRGSYMSLLQEIAEQFYVERADFTVLRTFGDDYAAHLSTSYPLLVRRDLGDTIGQMLRPTQKPWFHTVASDVRVVDNASRRWLQWADGTMRRAMYDPDAQLARATKEGDHDFASFGECVISAHLSRFRESLLYRCWHIKDVVWRENQDGKIDFVARKWKVAVGDLISYFPRADIDPKIRTRAQKNPFDETVVMHIVCGADLWDGNAGAKPRISIFYDTENERPIEVQPIWERYYIIPRWQTVSGSQYAFSPAAVAALPEGRLLQAMTLTLLEAGEKAVNPPLVATKDVVKSDMQQFPGGVTWVDAEYDERLGQALRAMNIDIKGLPITLDMVKDSRSVLMQCFFLNKLRAFNPTTDPQMTAFQAGQLVQEYIRNALPLFEPMEMEYNAALCEATFDILYRNGAFGSPQDLPQPLRNANIEFHFESPLHDAIEQQKATKFLEFKQIIAEAVTLDPTVAHIPDAKIILRDVADGIRVPAKWMHSELEVDESIDAAARARQQQQLLQTMQQGADVAQTLGAAKRDIAQAGAIGQAA